MRAPSQRSVRLVELILASGSPYRADVLRSAGHQVEVDAPQVDERAHDHLLATSGASTLAVELARMKAESVAPRHPGVPVVAGDQVGVLGRGAAARMLTKTPTAEQAVEQLMAMSGTRHELVNGLVVIFVESDGVPVSVSGTDVQRVQMTSYDARVARRYVESHRPFDTAGSYRLEDDAGLVESVEGEHSSGVLGMPLPLLERLLDELERRRAAAP